MKTLHFSLSSAFPIKEIAQDLETQSGNIITGHQLGWDDKWNEIAQIATYRTPMDVSEIGSTWIANLHSIGGIHLFSKPEIESLGGESAFLPASWKSCINPEDHRVWSIPWTVDTRFIFYRRNMLVKAGLDPTIAFISDTAFKNTLLAIKDEGITYPLTMATSHTRMVLHTAASWVWEAGGDFITPDGRSTLVTTTESLAGFYQYFELSRFLTHETSRLNGEQSDMFFTQGKAAIAISGPWLLQQAADTPEERANIGVAPLPGVSFLGGSNLILWDQSINIQASMALIRFLTSKQFQSTYFNRAGYFPSRLDVLSSPLYSQNPWYHSLSGNLLKGRSFLPLRLWGNVEDGLSRAIHQTWNEIFDSPDTDYHAIVDRNLKLINHRLSMTLSSNR